MISEFRDKIIHPKKPRKYRITGSLGPYDAYKWVKVNNLLNTITHITRETYAKIIRKIDKVAVDALVKGEDFTIPCSMGIIAIRRRVPKTVIENGKLRTTQPIDWNKTLTLWEEDAEAYNKRIFVRQEMKEVFRAKYFYNWSHYNNRLFYHFFPCKDLRVKITEAARENQLDTFNIFREDERIYFNKRDT